ncbi:transmembrane protein, putative [Bodo saltans]|uniref:Transmembrane protein, putative n=1 Tax=Bodo saltans TaxID=75058 RepID=A0A0S4IMY3_BODSA|nr:transmembrane protein, putative [Bodo saltans]|eukprot:CUE74088.1 transmembrane protein, putative [Bodo saltans]
MPPIVFKKVFFHVVMSSYFICPAFVPMKDAGQCVVQLQFLFPPCNRIFVVCYGAQQQTSPMNPVRVLCYFGCFPDFFSVLLFCPICDEMLTSFMLCSIKPLLAVGLISILFGGGVNREMLPLWLRTNINCTIFTTISEQSQFFSLQQRRFMIAVNFSPQIPTANAYLFGRKEDRDKNLTRNHMAGGSQLWSILKMVAISYLISSFMQEYLLSPKDKTDAASDDSGATTTAAQVALRNNNNNKKQASAAKAVPLTMLPDRIVVDFGFECRSGEELTFIACDKQSYVLEHEKLALPEASTSTSQDDNNNNNNNNNGGAPTTRRQHLPLPGKRFWGLGQQLVNIHGSHNALISVEDIYKHNVTVRLVATISSNGRTVKRFLDLVRYAKPPKATKRLFGETSSSSTIVAPTPVDYPVLQQEVADSPSPTSSDPALATAVVTKRSTAPGGGDYLSLITDDALSTVAPPPPPLPLIQKFLPTVEFSCVAEATMFNPIPQPLEDTLDIDEKGRYFPICEFKTFWVIDSQFIVLNATTAVSGSDDAEGVSSNIEELEEGARHHPRGFVNFTIHITNMPLWKFLVFTQMDKSFAMHETYGTMGSKEMDETKRIFLETNPWLLGLTFGVSMLHLLFEYLAFTNDVKFWKGRKNFTGLSLKSVVMEFYFSLIIFLYLFDGDETSWSVLAPSGVGGCLSTLPSRTT